ncbi:MAG: Hpt domain-containing protein, partial [Candidatus Obscuribacterales bacterium]|nr:Hpt domain-containing protein [Candidatus Obscuribacterales bacterium]
MSSDLINLDELKNLYGEASVRELLEMSLGEARGLVNELKAKIPARNSGAVSADAHQLKGMAATMTMNRLAELAHKLELCSKSQSWEECDTLLLSVDTCFAELEAFLKKV